MARSDFGFQIGSALATQYLTDSKYIRAGYIVVDTIAERNTLPVDTGNGGVIVNGSLCYVNSETKFYQYNGTAWVETLYTKTQVDNAIAAEALLRANADTALGERIDNISSLGRFLSVWNATTGLPETSPASLPYAYKAGDYYIVGKVGTTNYKPNGKEYDGTASTTKEDTTIKAGDFYKYDGPTTNVWTLISVSVRQYSWEEILNKPTTVSGYGITDAYTKTEIDTTVEELEEAISAEETARQEADTTLQTNITNEATARANADTALGTRIDNLDADHIAYTNKSNTFSGTQTIDLGATAQAKLEVKGSGGDQAFLLTREGGAQAVLEACGSIALFGTKTNHLIQVRTNYQNRMTIGIDGSVVLAADVGSTSNDNQVATTKWTNTKIGAAIDALDVTEVGEDGKYIKKIKEENGKIIPTVETFITDMKSPTDAGSTWNVPTEAAIKTYVSSYGGKIDKIYLNNVEQTITNKEVRLAVTDTKYTVTIDID